jgi:copper resistance protein D
MVAEPLLHWSDPVQALISFVGLFLADGAIGFRFAVLRGRLGTSADAVESAVYHAAARRAATIGLIGVLVSAVVVAFQLPALAARRHTAALQLFVTDFDTAAQVAMLGVASLGFVLAMAGKRAGWWMSLVGVIVGALRDALVGEWSQLLSAIHSLAAGLWIGSLFVLVVAGISAVLRDEPARARRGALVANMVNAFSPMALTCGMIVVLFGLILAWRHLVPLRALWTTPYGYTLIAKLCVVSGVFGLGAWNWRRRRPTLGTDGAAVAIRRSSISELSVAGIVLVLTAVLVSLPSPKAPTAAGPPPIVQGQRK